MLDRNEENNCFIFSFLGNPSCNVLSQSERPLTCVEHGLGWICKFIVFDEAYSSGRVTGTQSDFGYSKELNSLDGLSAEFVKAFIGND
ncbi:unnamed protein product [Cuscuta campestris]|uniref:Uncharacterized protein n=2 Tax=Cuscuta sect. Cleistogrammica TaxID=1824901 RepID=A0A484L159_9ASTE|nr:hypothetical protein DM860_004500 [Cuscuta australis]VFQ70020.1 unnamed protein product [Cuscuta campestris]